VARGNKEAGGVQAKAGSRRRVPRTAEALSKLLAQMVGRRSALAASSAVAELAFVDEVLGAVVKATPWRWLDAALARRDNATLAGAVDRVEKLLSKKAFRTKRAFRRALAHGELAEGALRVAYEFPDLDGPLAGPGSTEPEATDCRAARLRAALDSPEVLRILFGVEIGEPHGAVSAAEAAIAALAGVSRSTVRKARSDLERLRQ
jgi:hypothetical protein